MRRINASNVCSLAMFAVLLGITLLACSQQKEPGYRTSNYDFGKPQQVIQLDGRLAEISGITFSDDNYNLLLAQEDETGTLYTITRDGDEVRPYEFGADADYEDIARVGDEVFILRSDGNIVRFNRSGIESGNLTSVKATKKLLPKGEYEGLAYSALTQKLYILCKSCAVDNKKETLTIYSLDASNDKLDVDDTLTVDLKKLYALVGKKRTWRPAALAQHPVTKDWYILSSVNMGIVITDSEFKVKSAVALDGKLYKQPEGMAFDAEANLWISNEAGTKAGTATILKINYIEGDAN
ncbi:hypothetical protein GCM10011418_42310 [Sphingobacterium alkalisoli]|nr:SdiA-regulated domain-containing protein [Sphingobacterium alkalisoli]GGH30341.1 hypothetical protein GCM10011418_42310 [Sphingobacterium alkalisoli]